MRERVIAILGSGLIGESWAGLFAAYGYDVICWDKDLAVAKNAAKSAKIIASGIDTDTLKQGNINAVEGISEALTNVSWVQENIVESIPEKQMLYRQAFELASDDVLIASSTSSFSWTDLTEGLTNSDRVLTAHPFNPPHIMPLVEIYAASPAAVERAERLYRSLSREPVFLKRPATGHIANRLASALWREAVNIVAEDIADVEAVDRALMNGPGLRWSVIGAHMAYHLGGGEGGIRHYLQHLGPSQERRWADLGNPKLTADLMNKLIAGVEEEACGRSIQELADQRDAAIQQILKARNGGGTAGT